MVSNCLRSHGNLVAQPGSEPLRPTCNCHAMCIFRLDGDPRGEKKTQAKGRGVGEGWLDVVLEKGEMGWGVGRASGGAVCGWKHRPFTCRMLEAGVQIPKVSKALPKGGGGEGANGLVGEMVHGPTGIAAGLYQARLDLGHKFMVYVTWLQPLISCFK